MTQTAYDISVIICAYTQERWDDLIAAIESVQQQILPPKEIIVVIDYNPGLLKQVREDIPGVVAVENMEARGLSGARNSGIAVAKGQIIAFLDDDATAEPDWLIRLTCCCEDPQVLGAGGTVEPLWLSERPAWFPEEYYWVVGCTYRGLPEKLTVVRNPFGGCTCVRREVFEAVGGFRHSIGRVGGHPMGGEETEFCIRAKQRWPQKFFLYEPQAKIHHRIPSHRATWRYFRSRCYAEGLSKAIVARYVGAKDGLASERAYILRTLPQGIVQSLADALLQEGLTGLARAGAIVLGLALTIAGYLVGSTLLYLEKLKTERKNIVAKEETFLCNLPPSIKAEP